MNQNSATHPTVMNTAELLAVTDCVKYDQIIKTLTRRPASRTKIQKQQKKGAAMIAIRTRKNSYKFININIDKLKIKAFNAAIVTLSLYGLVTLITK